MNRIASLLAILSVLAMTVGLLLGTGSTVPQAVILGMAGTAVLVAIAAHQRERFRQLCSASWSQLLAGVLGLLVLLILFLLVDGAIAGLSPFNPANWSRLTADTGALGFIATVGLAYAATAALLAVAVHRAAIWLLSRVLTHGTRA